VERVRGFTEIRFIPAIEYIQAQRARAVLMREFAEAVSKFDVYVAPSRNPRETVEQFSSTFSVSLDVHTQAANLCGYPAVAVPNGLTRDGVPTSITFLGRLYNEAAVLAVAKAYQDRARWHERTPPLK
jgi:Asp-tRNA(Asn)/Glu-tRNA(Gln) amidotransferase A subunit family amidase